MSKRKLEETHGSGSSQPELQDVKKTYSSTHHVVQQQRLVASFDSLQVLCKFETAMRHMELEWESCEGSKEQRLEDMLKFAVAMDAQEVSGSHGVDGRAQSSFVR